MKAKTSSSNTTLDVDEIKRAAAGRWVDILSALTPIPADVLDGRNHPCPGCGGTDRFRFIDPDEGAVFCNQCFNEKNGDGIAAVEHYARVDFLTALRMIADYLGIASMNGQAHITNGQASNGQASPSKPKKKEPADEATLTKHLVSGLYDACMEPPLLEMYATAKPPITPAGIKQCGGRFTRWEPTPYCSHRVIRLDGRSPIDSPAVTAIVLLRVEGIPFPATGELVDRKTHTVGASVNSWLMSGNVLTAETILDVEGVTDLLAAASIGLPPGWVAVTNTAGADSRGKLPRPWAKGKQIIVAGDCDETGLSGIRRCREAYNRAGPSEILQVNLPYPVAKDHGKDLRDWILEGHTLMELPTIEAKVPKLRDVKAFPAATEFYPLTDTGNAERFALQHGDEVRYCYDWQTYLVWDGTRWNPDPAGVDQLAKQTIRSLYSEAADQDDDTKREAIGNWAKSSESAMRRDAMLKLARSEPPIPIRAESLDKHHWILNCINGKIDLKTGKLHKHRKEDYLTKLCPVEFQPDAHCPAWISTLKTLFAGDDELILYIQRFIGYCLTGDVSEQILSVWHGTGANGKSTLLNAITEMLGQDFSMKAPPNLLMQKRDGEHPTALTDLYARRLVACNETEANRHLAESLVKELTGSDPIRARRMHQDYWEFMPTHKVVLACNHKPVIRGTDHAIWRRVKLVPFNVTIPREERDKKLPAKLRAELPGILAWAVQGCLDWQREKGLGDPWAVTNATAEYQTAEDAIENFIGQNCILTGKVKASHFVESYRKWSGDKTMSTRRMTALMTEKEIQTQITNGLYYVGISLAEPEPKPENEKAK